LQRGAPPSANQFDSRGFTYLKLGEFDKAIADYDQALLLNPKKESSLYGRGIAKLKKGDALGQGDIEAAKAMRPTIVEDFRTYGL
jgi:tetratricopeptide (TPR) repeat protein